MGKVRPAEQQLDQFLAKYLPEIGVQTRSARAKLAALLPGAVQMVYDNYNFLVIGFGPTERPSEAIASIAVAPKHISLCFMRGVDLPDPKKLLRGSGNQVRNLRIEDDTTLDQPDVRKLIKEAVRRAAAPFATDSPGKLVIRSVSAKQRPRRPKQKVKGPAA
jgi:hypothetical protein